ncbi:hypothetical protein FKW77_008086 [Venturia effusa]|uniref:Uncharacterized protein n=1 Tax=Venturia effusa TaxID=50376 RepID=A0A517LE80_9PEZI|nr:hypothetical protein FKW77_008086 [Venturia effusa]
MEAAIRWSPHATLDTPQFLIVDVIGNRLKLCEIGHVDSGTVNYKEISRRDKLKNYTAFDWSKTDPNLVAIGQASGEACLIRLDADKSSSDEGMWSFPIKHQRKCNSIAFSVNNKLATGLEKHRTDLGMNIYNLNDLAGPNTRQQEPYRKLSADAVSSIKFFSSEPETLVCGVTRQCIKLFDLRDPSTTYAGIFNTKQVHNIAIDPMDENYFISAGPPGDPFVSVWDRRMAAKSGPQTASVDTGPQGPVLELKPAVNNRQGSTIWSLRFSGQKRGCFGVLSNTGEVKIVELGQYATKTTLTAPPTNQHGGQPWDSKHYTKRSHNLTYPWYDSHHGQEEGSRVIACDFMSMAGQKDLSVLALHPKETIRYMKVPDMPRLLNMTALDELYMGRDGREPFTPKYDMPTVAQDLAILQDRARGSDGMMKESEQITLESTARLDMLSIENFGHKAPLSYETPLHPSSGDQHQHLLNLWFPNYRPSLGDALKLLRTQRRRCHEGYLLNPQINKDIVQNDPWLVDMWHIIKRFEEMAKNLDMIAEGLDLSYLGIYAVWNNTLGNTHQNRILDQEELTHDRFVDAVVSIVHTKAYPTFRGHKTKYPAHRQLCLAICGWAFSKDRLRSYCRRLMDADEHYKAVVIAVMRGFKDLAQELLRAAIREKKISNIGLGAVIACENVGDEQRQMCEWMAEETEDPYLKALLNYFIKGDWKIVADMPQLALSDRVGVALKYLDDERLDEFIKTRTAEASSSGNTEGLVLTGLSDKALELFSNYITKFNDLQTAVLAMSFTCPLYLEDARFKMWQEIYDMHFQTWRAFAERNKYMEAHAQRARTSERRQFGEIDEHPATLRCAHCLHSLAVRTMHKGSDGSIAAVPAAVRSKENDPRMKPAIKGGQLCPRCSRRTPNCGICGLQLANPDPRTLKSGAAKKLAEDDPIARQTMHCMTCTHSFHGNHARDWFARHKTCPVPDCRCMCALLH